MPKSIIPWAFLLLSLGCYEQQEGCLDALASNFEVFSDDPCSDCCEYPPLTFTIKHLYDTVNFDLGKVYSNQLGQTFVPLGISFFISDVSLLQNQVWFPVDQTILISDGQDDIEQPDDVTIISRSAFDFSIGAFLNAGNYTRLRFSVGLNQPEFNGGSQTVFETDSHPLDTTDNDLWSDAEAYRMYRLDLLVDSTALDTVELVTSASPSITIELEMDVDKFRGEKLSIPLAIDYHRWFEDIDFMLDSQEVIRQKILRGIENSFVIIE